MLDGSYCYVCAAAPTGPWQLGRWNCNALVRYDVQVLREMLHKAGGVQVLDGWSITQAQVDGKGGGDVLRQENASFGSTVKPIRKARSSLQVSCGVACSVL